MATLLELPLQTKRLADTHPRALLALDKPLHIFGGNARHLGAHLTLAASEQPISTGNILNLLVEAAGIELTREQYRKAQDRVRESLVLPRSGVSYVESERTGNDTVFNHTDQGRAVMPLAALVASHMIVEPRLHPLVIPTKTGARSVQHAKRLALLQCALPVTLVADAAEAVDISYDLAKYHLDTLAGTELMDSWEVNDEHYGKYWCYQTSADHEDGITRILTDYHSSLDGPFQEGMNKVVTQLTAKPLYGQLARTAVHALLT